VGVGYLRGEERWISFRQYLTRVLTGTGSHDLVGPSAKLMLGRCRDPTHPGQHLARYLSWGPSSKSCCAPSSGSLLYATVQRDRIHVTPRFVPRTHIRTMLQQRSVGFRFRVSLTKSKDTGSNTCPNMYAPTTGFRARAGFPAPRARPLGPCRKSDEFQRPYEAGAPESHPYRRHWHGHIERSGVRSVVWCSVNGPQ
jgi:hypothetical protein